MTPRPRALASAVQLWRLNTLASLGSVLEADGRVYRDAAWRLLDELRRAGLWEPRSRSADPDPDDTGGDTPPPPRNA